MELWEYRIVRRHEAWLEGLSRQERKDAVCAMANTTFYQLLLLKHALDHLKNDVVQRIQRIIDV